MTHCKKVTQPVFVCLLLMVSVSQLTAQSAIEKKSIVLPTGITMKYTESGKQGGTAIVMLHGLSDTSKSFEQTIAAMLKRDPDLHIVALDLRGHGGTSMPDATKCAANPQTCFEMTDFVEDVVAALNALDLKRVHLVGHSLGSFITQEVALRFPDRLYSITLIASTTSTVASPAVNDFIIGGMIEGQWKKAFKKNGKGRWPHDVYALKPSDVDVNADRLLQENWVVEPTAEDAFLKSILADTRLFTLGAWIGVTEMLRHWDNSEQLKDLRVPALVLWATQDPMFPRTPDQDQLLLSLDAALERDLPRYFFKVYGRQPLPASGFTENDYGHNTHWGAPLATAADIVSFVRHGQPLHDHPYADTADIRVERKDDSTSSVLSKGE